MLNRGHVGDTGLENCIYSPVAQDDFDLLNGAFSGKSSFHPDSRQWIRLVPNDAGTSSMELLQKGFGSLVYLVNPVVLLSSIFEGFALTAFEAEDASGEGATMR